MLITTYYGCNQKLQPIVLIEEASMITNQIYLLITLVTAHVIGDFLLQTKRDVDNKANGKVFAKHIIIIAILSYIFVGIWSNWLIPLIIAATHAAIDLIKLKTASRNSHYILSFSIDQAAHLLIIGIIAAAIGTTTVVQSFWLDEFGYIFLVANLYVSGIIITVLTGGIVVGMLVKPFLDQIDDKNKGLLKGGEIIGKLERLLIFLFVISGNITAVGFLVAAKSIFRFGELHDSNNRKQAEYILIGTLYSFSWAFICSWFAQKFVEVI